MTVHDKAIAKIRQLPEPLAQEVSDFVDFLLIKSNGNQWARWVQFSESHDLAEADLPDYLSRLEAYEDDLASGKIRW